MERKYMGVNIANVITIAIMVLFVSTVPVVSAKDNIGEHTNHKIIDHSIKQGLIYLNNSQLSNGQFPSYISDSPNMNDSRYIPLLFDTTFIAHTLNLAADTYPNEMEQKMRKKTVDYLLENREKHGVWRIYGKSNTFFPPDTDDTAMAFSAIVESGETISDESLDYILNFRSQEGVFNLQITDDEWLDPTSPLYTFFKMDIYDAVVNADILYANSLRNRNPEGVVKYLNNITKSKAFLNGTIFYPSPYVYSYVITKAYSEGGVKDLQPSISTLKRYMLSTQKPDGSWGNDLDSALATAALLNIGYEGKSIDKAIKHIIGEQHENGSWDAYAFYSGPVFDPSYFGSPELTTSFNVEALIKYNQNHKEHDEERKKDEREEKHNHKYKSHEGDREQDVEN